MAPAHTESPSRGGHHIRNQSLSEAVLVPQAIVDAPPDMLNGDTPKTDEASVDLAAHHEALIGDEFRNPTNIIKQPTLATLGDTPFDDAQNGDELEHHRIVATEIVNDIQFDSPEPILQNAIVLLDPKIPDCTFLIEAGRKRGLMIMAVVPKPNDGSKKNLVAYYPTAEALLEVGMHQVYEPPVGSKFDIVECATNLKTIESQQNLRFLGVIPCREAAVDFADILGALLGLTVVNDLGLASARRDKGLMKVAVANAGLRVAKYARLTQGDGSDVIAAVEELELEYPVVVKTPRGMSTMDVFICNSEKEAVQHASEIVRSVGPDGSESIDVDKSGTIEMSEFQHAFQACDVPYHVAVMMSLDEDNSGTIDRDEFKDGIKLLNARLSVSEKIPDSDEEVNRLFDELDESGDGELDMAEFEKFVRDYFPH